MDFQSEKPHILIFSKSFFTVSKFWAIDFPKYPLSRKQIIEITFITTWVNYFKDTKSTDYSNLVLSFSQKIRLSFGVV